MIFNLTKFSTIVAIFGALAGTTLTTTPVQAQNNRLGAAILGGIVGGIVAGSIRRCHSHGGYRHCHYHTGVHNHYRSGIYYLPAPPRVYAPPPPVYAPIPSYPAPAGFPSKHYKWCYNRYNSYNQPSNTFQPYGNVPRRICRSPWG